MQRVGLDRIDLARRPPAQQQHEGQPQHQAAEAWHQQRAQRLDTGLARQPIPYADVEQERMQARHRDAHRQHHQAGDNPDQRRQHHQAGFMGTHERPQPAWRLEVAGGGDHFRGP